MSFAPVFHIRAVSEGRYCGDDFPRAHKKARARPSLIALVFCPRLIEHGIHSPLVISGVMTVRLIAGAYVQ